MSEEVKLSSMLIYVLPYARVHLKIVLLLFIFLLVTMVRLMPRNLVSHSHLPSSVKTLNFVVTNATAPPLLNISELRSKWIQRKLERIPSRPALKEVKFEPMTRVNHRAQTFYFAWFKNPSNDAQWSHWNDEETVVFEPYATAETAGAAAAVPGLNIRTSFFPQLGFYSSRNASVVDIHMEQLRRAGIGVVIVAWLPPGIDDSPDDILSSLMDAADVYDIKLALHIKRYDNRNIYDILHYVKDYLSRFGDRKTVYRVEKRGKMLPVFYIYDPYDISSNSWASLLSPHGSMTLRGGENDGVFLGLLADFEHRMEIKKSSFDGFYTYYAGNGYTYGSTWKNWQSLGKFARDNQLDFVPCIAPGFSEPEGGSYNKPRHHGNYFEVAMRTAIDVKAKTIAITSFNGWEDGSQLEPALPKRIGHYSYMDYRPHKPNFYLELAGWWIKWWTLRDG